MMKAAIAKLLEIGFKFETILLESVTNYYFSKKYALQLLHKYSNYSWYLIPHKLFSIS